MGDPDRYSGKPPKRGCGVWILIGMAMALALLSALLLGFWGSLARASDCRLILQRRLTVRYRTGTLLLFRSLKQWIAWYVIIPAASDGHSRRRASKPVHAGGLALHAPSLAAGPFSS